MNRALNIMLDIETTALTPNARITSLALVPFNENCGLEAHHYVVRDYTGGSIETYDDPRTMEWRRENQVDDYEGKAVWEGTADEVALPELLDDLTNVFGFWRANFDPVYLWAWHIDFDVPALRRLFVETSTPVPWDYRHTRDVPTYLHAKGHDPSEVKKMATASVQDQPGGTDFLKHDAYADCVFQIRALRLA